MQDGCKNVDGLEFVNAIQRILRRALIEKERYLTQRVFQYFYGDRYDPIIENN